MTPEQFLRQLTRGGVPPVCLFVGPEGYRRKTCRQVLLDKVLPNADDREEGFTRHDLDELTLSEVVDDARAMSLFARDRLIWVTGAELAMPKGRAAAASDEDGAPSGKHAGGIEALTAYCGDPTPGVVLVFDTQRWDFDGEDKAKLERLVKFYGAIETIVEFARMNAQDARLFAQTQASERGLKIAGPELDQLVEATAADPSRISSEIEKLSLFAKDNKVTSADISALVPNAQETTIFNLVAALARRDRMESLALLDTLIREGEYLPLALTFLSGLFRMALSARELNLRSAQDVQSYYQRQGVPMWRARAEQIALASSKFPREKLEQGIQAIFRADRDMKSARPDDRLVMEEFVLRLTA